MGVRQLSRYMDMVGYGLHVVMGDAPPTTRILGPRSAGGVVIALWVHQETGEVKRGELRHGVIYVWGALSVPSWKWDFWYCLDDYDSWGNGWALAA